VANTSVKRIVVGTNAAGRSALESTTSVPIVEFDPAGGPGGERVWAADVWITPRAHPTVNEGPVERAWELEPPEGGTVWRVVYFPAHSQGTELHKTQTIDVALVLQGRVWCVLEEGGVEVGPGDWVVQRGTVHAWDNRYDEGCLMAVALVSARA